MTGFNVIKDENLIVGYDKSDDASIYKINDDLAIIFTTDFFPPIADDPYLFGQIAATNSLSDVYAMGGRPNMALNIMCIKEGMDMEVVKEILHGGYDKCYEANCIISGGHTIQGKEPFYGLAVTGFVHPKRVLTNSNVKVGDVLICTKLLGIGILTTANKGGLLDKSLENKIYKQMATLNKDGINIALNYDIHATTDITGFGMIGHLYEMANGSSTTIHITTDSIKYYPEAETFANMGLIPAGAYRNRKFAENEVKKIKNVALAVEDILYDPQTSGGLLLSVAANDADKCLRALIDGGVDAYKVGYVANAEDKRLVIE